jgi:hypothetical protein
MAQWLAWPPDLLQASRLLVRAGDRGVRRKRRHRPVEPPRAARLRPVGLSLKGTTTRQGKCDRRRASWMPIA